MTDIPGMEQAKAAVDALSRMMANGMEVVRLDQEIDDERARKPRDDPGTVTPALVAHLRTLGGLYQRMGTACDSLANDFDLVQTLQPTAAP